MTHLLSPVRRTVASIASVLLATFTLGTGLAFADEIVVDNTDPSWARTVGPWNTTTTTPGYLGDNYVFRTAGEGQSTFTWIFPATAQAGRYEVFARWSAGPNRASNATYVVSSNAGHTPVTVSQKVNGGAWRSLGIFEFQGKGQNISLSDKADGVVVADAIRFVGPLAAGATQSAASTSSPTPAASQPVAQPAPVLAPVATPAPAPANPNDPRYFAQTRYRISEDAFWDFFQKRGGARTFGYPVSNTFTLFGMKVQVFQRLVMQLRPDGGVQTLNLLDDGLLPYTKINGSTFPASDPGVVGKAPDPSDPDYLEKALQFVKDNAPDTFDGEQVNFNKTFLSTVRPEDAFPSGVPDGLAGLVPGFNLEIWGLPTSRPTYEPTNRGFIYQRFQRGIMHYDKACGCTQGLLLADYLKAVATNKNLPGDLAAQVKGNRFFGQWAPTQSLALARPGELPGSNFTNAFRRDPMVTVDPGHGGKEIGTSARYPDGTVTQEKSLNLRVALRLRELLQQNGFDVTMTRTTDSQVNTDGKDTNGDKAVGLSDDLQARIDVANRAGSDAFVSVHFNGVSDPNFKGTYTFWAPDRPHSDRNKALAEAVQAAMVKSLKDAGYQTIDRGARTDTSVLGGGHYFLLGPQSDVIARPSNMPAIIGEPLFLTNADDANAIRKDAIVEAVARGYLEGLRAYFTRYPAG